MLSFLLVAAAAALTGGDSIAPDNWIKSTDFPMAAMMNQTDAIYELSVDEAGKPFQCEFVVPSRNASMNKAICRALLKRAAKTPLLESDGHAVPFVARGIVAMRYRREGAGPEGTKIRKSSADIVATSTLIAADSAPAYVRLIEIIDRSGEVESCAVIEKSGNDQLDRKGCDIIAQPEYTRPVKDRSGEVIRAARGYDILFSHGTTDSSKMSTPAQ